MNKNLVLTGMMGVGKSTIGKKLAKRLFFNYIDIDSLIEKKEGCSINQIFKRKGENYFRTLEYDMILQSLKKKNSVISLGGGAFLNKSTRKVSKKLSIIFWLDVNNEIIIQRLKNTKKRPLLFKKNLSDEIKKIYLERKKFYNEANYRIKCSFFKPKEIVDQILELYEKTEIRI